MPVVPSWGALTGIEIIPKLVQSCGCWTKNRGVFHPKSSILIGFGTIIFTIHFGGPPLFLETPMCFLFFLSLRILVCFVYNLVHILYANSWEGRFRKQNWSGDHDLGLDDKTWECELVFYCGSLRHNLHRSILQAHFTASFRIVGRISCLILSCNGMSKGRTIPCYSSIILH